MAAYQPLPRSSPPSASHSPASPPRALLPAARTISLTTRAFFRIDAVLCCLTAIPCIAAGTSLTRNYHSGPYTQSLIVVYVALGLSLLSQLAAVAAPYVSKNLHVNVAWKGKDWNAAQLGAGIHLPPAARPRRRSLGAVLGNGLLGGVLVIGGLVFTIIAQLRANPPVAVVGVVFCFFTG